MKLIARLRQFFSGNAVAPAAVVDALRSQPVVVPEVKVDELQAQLAADTVLLLDCREKIEWKQARIAGCRHIPMNQTPSRLDELDRARRIVVYCATGNRSFTVAEYLIRNGFEAANLRGGIQAWEAAGGPTESDYRFEN